MIEMKTIQCCLIIALVPFCASVLDLLKMTKKDRKPTSNLSKRFALPDCRTCQLIEPPNCSIFIGRKCSMPKILYNFAEKCLKMEVMCGTKQLAILGSIDGYNNCFEFDLYFLARPRGKWWITMTRDKHLTEGIRMVLLSNCTEGKLWQAETELHNYVFSGDYAKAGEDDTKHPTYGIHILRKLNETAAFPVKKSHVPVRKYLYCMTDNRWYYRSVNPAVIIRSDQIYCI
ncbi:unnamed protein product [Thelazia callipaeda]|uniref:Fgf n=1 Tax=Thelazia callipaeda TaxID=103827 RepID=A0A0N5D681_THECL|nr:unnamed protein product [Thelazia callipaeda]